MRTLPALRLLRFPNANGNCSQKKVYFFLVFVLTLLRSQRVGQGLHYFFLFVMSSEPREPALHSLLAGLTVSRTSRDPGRVPGFLGLGKISASPSSENFTLVNDGASHKSPMMGQPRTVNSLEDELAAPRGMPSSISLLSPASL
jgi:hypothetical protein